MDWHTSIEKVIKERISKAVCLFTTILYRELSYKPLLTLLNYFFFQKSQLKDILLSVDLETTPEFLVEIILTYVSTNYENIQVSYRLLCVIFICL